MTGPAPSFPQYKLADGLNVLTLQELLTSAGFQEPMTGLDGSYGLRTEEAVRRYQRAKHLNTSGVADEETWDKLTDRTVRRGEPDVNLVTAVQVGLFKHHLLKGEFEDVVDGDFGEGTEGGVRTLQALWRLPDTGAVDPTTWRYLIAYSAG